MPVRATYHLVVRPYTPEDPGQFVVTVHRQPGWNLALSWAAMVVVVVGLVVLFVR